MILVESFYECSLGEPYTQETSHPKSSNNHETTLQLASAVKIFIWLLHPVKIQNDK